MFNYRPNLSSLTTVRCSHPIAPALALMCVLALVYPSPSVAQNNPEIYPRVSDERSPPGGMIQLKVKLTIPEPIITGDANVEGQGGAQGPLGPPQGVALFAEEGDVSGAAVVRGQQVSIRFLSRHGTFGTDEDSPIIVVSMPVRPDAAPGQIAPLNLDPSTSFWVTPSGQLYEQEVQPGTFTVGGSVAISNVVPGGGLLPAGATVTISGMGFQPGASVEIDDVKLVSTRYVGPTQLEVVLADGIEMHGRRICVRNRDRSGAMYYSYLRAAALGESRVPLLAATVPIFSTRTFTQSFFFPVLDRHLFLGMAFQNPNPRRALITIELFSAARQLISSSRFTLPSQTRISREISEYLSEFDPRHGDYLRVSSNVPVQVIGLIGNVAEGTVVPVDPS